MRDYLGDLVIYIVPYRRFILLCVREVFIVCTLLCWYCMRLSRLYYVIWTFHVLSLYVFLSHLLFLCVTVYLSLLLSNCNCNYEGESVQNIC